MDLSLKVMILAQNWPKTAKSSWHCSKCWAKSRGNGKSIDKLKNNYRIIYRKSNSIGFLTLSDFRTNCRWSSSHSSWYFGRLDDCLYDRSSAISEDLTHTLWSSILSTPVRGFQEPRKQPKNICAGDTVRNSNEWPRPQFIARVRLGRRHMMKEFKHSRAWKATGVATWNSVLRSWF